MTPADRWPRSNPPTIRQTSRQPSPAAPHRASPDESDNFGAERPRRAGRSRPPKNRRACERSASTRRTPARDANPCGATRRRSLRATRQCLPRQNSLRSAAMAPRAALPRLGRPHADTNCRRPSVNGSRHECRSTEPCCASDQLRRHLGPAVQAKHLFDLDPVHGHGLDRQAKGFASGRQRHLGETCRGHDGWPCTL